jgi:hypothetical protein
MMVDDWQPNDGGVAVIVLKPHLKVHARLSILLEVRGLAHHHRTGNAPSIDRERVTRSFAGPTTADNLRAASIVTGQEAKLGEMARAVCFSVPNHGCPAS